MKILLILPAVEHLRVTDRRQAVPPRAMLRFSVLPLTVVAGLTPPPHTVTLCDENVEPLDFDADVDVVGLSFMTALAPRAYQIADEFRRRGKIVVAGGYHPTFCPDEVAQHVDAVVVGEAECSWPQVLQDIEAGRLERVYRAAAPCDLSRGTRPRRDLTARTARHYATTCAVQASRGCAHRCRYCSVTAFHGGTHRTRPVEHVLAELRELPRGFMFVDDNIVADPEYARALFQAMVPLGKRWVSQCSLTIADDPDLLALAHRAGCRGLFIGIETLDDRNLAAVGKDCNRAAAYREKLRRIRRQGIGVVAGIIVGLDQDDVGVFERMLGFLQQTGIGALQLNILTPLPGTPLFEEFAAAGRIPDRDWGHYDFRHVVITPARMSAQELQDGADWLYREFYRLDRVAWRVLRTLVTSGPVPAWLALRLNLTYRLDNRREHIVGHNPATTVRPAAAGADLLPEVIARAPTAV